MNQKHEANLIKVDDSWRLYITPVYHFETQKEYGIPGATSLGNISKYEAILKARDISRKFNAPLTIEGGKDNETRIRNTN
jgi:hypothetical protein